MSKTLSEMRSVMLNSREIEIPVEWDIQTIDEVAEKTKGTKPDSLFEEPHADRLPYLTISASKGEVNQWAQANDGKQVSEKEILIVWDGASSGTVFKSSEGIIGSTLASLMFHDNHFDSEFVYYFLRHNEDRISTLTEGTGISHVPRDFTEIFQVLKPPVSEQRRIADILSTVDKQIQQIENILDNKRELRKGLITKLIRSGLNTDNPISKRIGPKEYQIAGGWELREVHEMAIDEKKAIRGGPSGTQLKGAEYGTNGAKVYGQEHVSNRDFTRGNKYLAEGEFSDFKSVEILPDDILVTMMGTVGDSAAFPSDAEKGIMDSHLLRIRPNQEIVIPEFLSLIISESKLVEDQIQSLSHGLVMSGLNIGIVESLTVPVPPLDEQQRFVEIISKSSDSTDIEETRLQSLKDMKRGLMQDLLTGKVRVDPTN